ncbi:MAG: hypothetical protein ACFFCS_00760 [Candidatus Hodarchaeota archaeon]
MSIGCHQLELIDCSGSLVKFQDCQLDDVHDRVQHHAADVKVMCIRRWAG